MNVKPFFFFFEEIYFYFEKLWLGEARIVKAWALVELDGNIYISQ